MNGSYVTIDGPDGSFQAYVSRPAQPSAPGVVVIQEIFGVNAVMREITDDLASKGYLAICPDLFWRLEPGIELTDRTEAEWAQAKAYMGRFDIDKGIEDLAASINFARANEGSTGKVGMVGFCLGGRLAFLTATRTDADAAVGYYGIGLENLADETVRCPLLLHVAGQDSFSSKEAEHAVVAALGDNPLVSLAIYPERDHAFARPGGEHYHQGDADLAEQRTLDHLAKALA